LADPARRQTAMKIESVEPIPVEAPKGPGLGLELDWDLVEKYRLRR
jgi:L-alanine-DL-glutamate epimerase-like enolase superfamily enzyme